MEWVNLPRRVSGGTEAGVDPRGRALGRPRTASAAAAAAAVAMVTGKQTGAAAVVTGKQIGWLVSERQKKKRKT